MALKQKIDILKVVADKLPKQEQSSIFLYIQDSLQEELR